MPRTMAATTTQPMAQMHAVTVTMQAARQRCQSPKQLMPLMPTQMRELSSSACHARSQMTMRTTVMATARATATVTSIERRQRRLRQRRRSAPRQLSCQLPLLLSCEQSLLALMPRPLRIRIATEAPAAEACRWPLQLLRLVLRPLSRAPRPCSVPCPQPCVCCVAAKRCCGWSGHLDLTLLAWMVGASLFPCNTLHRTYQPQQLVRQAMMSGWK